MAILEKIAVTFFFIFTVFLMLAPLVVGIYFGIVKDSFIYGLGAAVGSSFLSGIIKMLSLPFVGSLMEWLNERAIEKSYKKENDKAA